MPQLASSAKRLRQSIVRGKRNAFARQNIDYLFRQFKKAITVGDGAKASEFVTKLIPALDKAAKKNIIKPRKSARHKSQLMKKINQLKKPA
jgi:small subunit ribosomal protein S20